MMQHFLRDEPGIYYEDLYPLVSFLPRHTVHPSSEVTVDDVLPIWNDHIASQSMASSSTSSPEGTLKSKRHRHRNDSFDPEKALPRVISDVPLRGARIPPRTRIYDYVPLLIVLKPILSGPKWLFRRMFRKQDEEAENTGLPAIDSNVPLEIMLFLQSYLQFLLKNSYVPPAIASGMVSCLSSLQDTVTSLERVGTTPLPFAYQVSSMVSP